MKKSCNSVSYGALLGIVFIILKLCNVIAWSWVWVLAPFWVSFALAFIIIILAVMIKFIKKKR